MRRSRRRRRRRVVGRDTRSGKMKARALLCDSSERVTSEVVFPPLPYKSLENFLARKCKKSTGTLREYGQDE